MLPENDPTTSDASPPHKRRATRVQPIVSCLECRRMKWKCDREFPCHNCAKRGLASICPGGRLNGLKEDRETIVELQHKVQSLEALVTQYQAQLQLASPDGAEPLVEDTAQPDIGQLTVGDEPGSSKFFGNAGAAYLASSTEAPKARRESGIRTSLLFRVSGNLDDLQCNLPEKTLADRFVDIYFTDASFMNTVVDRGTIDAYLVQLYPAEYLTRVTSVNIDNHRLAIVFLVLAIGSQMDLGLPPYNGISERYFGLAKAALALNTSSSIPLVQAIMLMSRYHVNSSSAAEYYEEFWPVLGYGVRSAQAIGLHRDGRRWGLEPEELQLRRRIFWEIHCEDTLQSMTQGRPKLISTEMVDVELPEGQGPSGTVEAEFQLQKYRLVQICGRINDIQCQLKPTKYEDLLQIDTELRKIFKAFPPILVGLTGSYRDDLQRLVLKVYHAESLMFLHRSHFARALRDHPNEPLQSPLRWSVVTEIEASETMILVLRDALAVHKALVSRFWIFFFHAFTSIVNFAAYLVRSPNSVLSDSIFSRLTLGLELFESVEEGHRARDDLPKLQRICSRAQNAMTNRSKGIPPTPAEAEAETSLLGLGTVLRRVKNEKDSKSSAAQASLTEPIFNGADFLSDWDRLPLVPESMEDSSSIGVGIGVNGVGESNFDFDSFFAEMGVHFEHENEGTSGELENFDTFAA